MSKITPGNRLYLYQLLSRELGVGRQALVARAEEALAADGLCPADLGCEDMRKLCEELGEFVKLTVFKKGYVYATILSCEEYDRALESADSAKEKATGGKPWKRRRGAKALRPVKPRHVEVPEEPEVPDAPSEAAEAEEAAEAVAEELVIEADVTAAPITGEAEAEGADSDEAAEPGVPTEDEANDAAADGEANDAAAEDGATAEPEHEAAPAPVAEPAISLTITYVPETEAAPEPAREPAAASAPATAEPPRVQRDLPQDFHRDVRCPSEQLSVLYQVLPPDVDPMATLEEDFRVARSMGALEGTRSNVTFALRYLQPDGQSPVTVTLRRSARPVAGKRWALTAVDAGAPADVGLEGLTEVAGPLAQAKRLLASTIQLDSWDEAIARLADGLAPDDWGPERCVLGGYLALTFARVEAKGLLRVSEDGRRAWFDTGLLDATGAPLFAQLSACDGDIPWHLDGFAAEPGAGKQTS